MNNKLLEELTKKAYKAYVLDEDTPYYDHLVYQVVRECLSLVKVGKADAVHEAIKQHFGVEE